MNKAVPWNINGVGFDAREAAREAARRQGKSLGEWLDGVIAEHAASLGVEADAVGGQERIDAVTSRLERLSERAEAPEPRRVDRSRAPEGDRERPKRRDRFSNHHADAEDASDDEIEGRGVELAPRYRRAPRERARSGERDQPQERDRYADRDPYGDRDPYADRDPYGDRDRYGDETAARTREGPRAYRPKVAIETTELVLEEAIEAMERRASRAERKTDKALASFAKIIETTENKHDDDREMFGALSRKLSDMESRIASRVADDSYRPIKGALARLEARLDALGRRAVVDAQAGFGPAMPAPPPLAPATRQEPAPVPMPSPVPVATTPPEPPPAPRVEPAANPSMDRLESKLNAILDALRSAPAAAPAALASRPMMASEPAATPYPAPRPVPEQRLGAAIAAITDHQRALERAAARDAARAERQAGELDGGPFRHAAGQSGRLAPRGEGDLARPAAESGASVHRLRAEMADLACKVDDLRRDLADRAEPTAASDAGQRRIEALQAEIAALRRASLETPRVALNGQAAQLDTALEDLRLAITRGQIDRRKDSAKLETVASRADVDGLKAEIAVMSRTLGQLAPRDKVVALEEAIRGLVARVDGAYDKTTRDAMLRPIYEVVGNIRDWLTDSDLRATIGVLEREVRAIGAKLEKLNGVDAAALMPIQNQMDELRELMSAAAARSLPLERIEQQVARLTDRMDRPSQLAASVNQSFQAAADEMRAMLRNPPGLALFDKIEQRLEALGSKVDQAIVEASGARDQVAARSLPLEGIARQLATLTEKMDRMPRVSAKDDGVFQAAAAEIKEMLRGAPGAAVFDKIEQRLEALGSKVDQAIVEASGARDQAAAARSLPLEGIARQLATLTETMDRMPRVSAKDDGVFQAAAAEIKDMLRGAPGAAMFDKIEQRLEALSAKVDRAAEEASGARSEPLERIERQVASLTDKMDRMPRLSAKDDGALQAAAAEIRALLQNAPEHAGIDKIERHLEALAGKVDQAVNEASGAREVAELSRRHLDTMQRHIATRLDTERREPSTDLRSLESLVRDLSDRIEAVRAPDAGGHAIEALQAQIVELAGRFERTDSELSILPGIERSMHALFAHLEDTRASVETAAAKAARQALESVPRGEGLDPKAAREIAALKAIQADADQRTHATLNAVHETLEKVVDRLSLMETDIATARAAPRASAPQEARPQEPRPQEPRPQAARPQAARPQAALGPFADAIRREPAQAAEPRPKAKSPPAFAMPDLMLEPADALDEPVTRPSADRRRPAGAASREAPRMAVDLDDGLGRADFIAAARRAAKAAQSDPTVLAMKQVDAGAEDDTRAKLLSKTRDYVESHKKPVLMGVAALFVTLGTLAVVGSIKVDDAQAPGRLASATPARAPKMADAAAVTAARTPAASAKTAEAAPPRQVGALAPAVPARQAMAAATPGRATAADLTPSALPTAPAPMGEKLGGADPMITASIPHLPSFAAASPIAVAPAGPPLALKQLADGGNAGAQYEMASRYAEGRGLPKDFATAATWYEKAARQNLAPAQYKLASLYEKGLGVARDSAKARFWYTKAAEAGNPRAMHNLAVLIADGDGKPDYAGAVVWFRRAAEYGVHDSQYNLGILLARGLGAPQALVQSYQWFAIAARENDADAATKRDEVGSKMSASDIAVAKALAAAFHPKTPDVVATEVDAPAGGWDGASSPSLVKSARPKLSSL